MSWRQKMFLESFKKFRNIQAFKKKVVCCVRERLHKFNHIKGISLVSYQNLKNNISHANIVQLILYSRFTTIYQLPKFHTHKKRDKTVTTGNGDFEKGIRKFII